MQFDGLDLQISKNEKWVFQSSKLRTYYQIETSPREIKKCKNYSTTTDKKGKREPA